MNKVNLIGRIAHDLELRTNQNNIDVIKFRIAVKKKKNEDGTYSADFISCIAFQERAKLIYTYFRKGNQIGISGSIRTSSYEGSDGKKKYSTDVLVEDIDFIDKKDNQTSGDTTSPITAQSEVDLPDMTDPFTDFAGEVEISDADLPFN